MLSDYPDFFWFISERLDQKEIVSLEELLISNVYTQEALINFLEKKGLIGKKELLEETKKLRREQIKISKWMRLSSLNCASPKHDIIVCITAVNDDIQVMRSFRKKQ